MIEQFLRNLDEIQEIDMSREPHARKHLDGLTKPNGSLGRLEDIVTLLVCMAGERPLVLDPVRLFTVAGDHGIVSDGVSPYPQEVTRQMLANFLAGGAAINVLSRQAGAQLKVVDAGCVGERFAPHPDLIDRRVRSGTANFLNGPAMTEEECVAALQNGIDLVRDAVAEGCRCVGIGEMGIGNTTPATALFAAYLHIAPAVLTGPGSGLDRDGVHRKALVVQRALNAHARVLSIGKPLSILATLGGLEIATMSGIVLGAARYKIPCLIDGFIAQSSYLSAIKLCPAAEGYCFITHVSGEPGSNMILPAFNKKPLLDLGLRLGEGTGCALAVPILRASIAIYDEMATLVSAGVSDTTSRSA